MERMWMERQAVHLRGGNDDAGRVAALVQLGLDAQARCGAGVANQVDNRFKRAERTASPVLGDVTEEAVLYLVPLAGAGREMRDVDPQAQVVGQALQFFLPRARAVPIAAARIGGDEEGLGLWGGPSRSEERRVGKECRSRWSPYHLKKKKEKRERSR